jgi:hypothetical protein
MLKTSECAACLAFGCMPPELAVDPACVSPRADDGGLLRRLREAGTALLALPRQRDRLLRPLRGSDLGGRLAFSEAAGGLAGRYARISLMR